LIACDMPAAVDRHQRQHHHHHVILFHTKDLSSMHWQCGTAEAAFRP
jgi:hypothetical protein